MQQLTRSELRKIIMTILYQINVYDDNKIKYEINDVIKESLEIDNDFVKDAVYGVITHQEEIDKLINDHLNNWTLSRLGYTDQAIFRLAVYELNYTNTPPVVIINEALELAKDYSDDDVKKMINGVLDKIYHEKVNNE